MTVRRTYACCPYLSPIRGFHPLLQLRIRILQKELRRRRSGAEEHRIGCETAMSRDGVMECSAGSVWGRERVREGLQDLRGGCAKFLRRCELWHLPSESTTRMYLDVGQRIGQLGLVAGNDGDVGTLSC